MCLSLHTPTQCRAAELLYIVILLIISLILNICALIEAKGKRVSKAEVGQDKPFNIRGEIEMCFVKDLLKYLTLQAQHLGIASVE